MSAPLGTKNVPPLALLAGGLATRLGALTASVPKSLLQVAGEPFIAHQLRLLGAQGVQNIVICSGHFGDQIEDFVGNGSRFGCWVSYSHDGSSQLGTGGAVRKALPLLGSCFWVMYGDSYLTAPFTPVLDAFRNSRQPALMTVFQNENRWDTSNVLFEQGKVLRYDKKHPQPGMRHIDYGLGLFSGAAFEGWSDASAFDLGHLQALLVEGGCMAGYRVDHRFYEIGSPAGLRETDAFLTESMRGVPA